MRRRGDRARLPSVLDVTEDPEQHPTPRADAAADGVSRGGPDDRRGAGGAQAERAGRIDGPGHAELTESELADRLATVPAGALLASILESLDLEALDSYDIVEVAAAADRAASWAHRVKVAAAAALHEHPDMRPRAPVVGGRGALEARQLTAATLAMRLQVPAREADALVREAQAYAGALADTGDALAEGAIDPPRARALVNRLWDQPVPVALAVESDVLPAAPGRTVTQLRRDVERSLARHDGIEAAARARVARERRCVSRPRQLVDGMAGLWVVLPAVQAVRVDRVLDAAARAARAAGDERTLDQLRADELTTLVTGEPDVLLDGAPAPGIEVAAAPVPDAGGSAPDDGGAARRPGRSPATVVHVTVALSTLIGEDDLPADLEGYGPVDAVQARALALGGVWRRLVTDPQSGAVLDVGRTRYRPPAALDEHVRIRDRYCSAPGCLVPSARSDLDHTVEFGEREDGGLTGTTSAENLGPACRLHHRLKTEGGFTLRQRVAGLFDWGTPSGHVFRTRPGADAPTLRLSRTGPSDPGSSSEGERPERGTVPPF